MNKLLFVTLTLSSLVLFSGCSYAPGVPGLNVSSSRYAKVQKEGVDYKLVVINAMAIKNQKPFNYVSYIASKKKRGRALSSISKSQRAVSNVKRRANIHPKSVRAAYSIKQGASNFPNISPNDNKANYRYTIGKNDILSITVWDNPELTIPSENAASAGHVVGNDGRFYFPYAGKIRALGKTTGEIRSALEKKLKKFITNPQISVRVAQFRSKKAYVSGAVLKPSTLQVSDVPMTVRDAILKSGGVTPNLFTGYASLARGNRKISIDLNKMLSHNDNSQNFLLKNGDRLHIIEKDEFVEWRKGLNLEIQKERALNPIKLQFELQKERSVARLKKQLERELKSEQAKVFVMGEVNKPGSVIYQVEDGMTLAEAINDSGSLREETVNPNGIFVVRKESPNDTIPTVYQLPLASVHSMFLAEQFTIRPRDVVYVTATPSIRWNRVLAQLIPSLTLVNTVSNLSR
jgi:polysaccharide export outer membrane protein